MVGESVKHERSVSPRRWLGAQGTNKNDANPLINQIQPHPSPSLSLSLHRHARTSQLTPTGEYVLAKVAAIETKTKAGVMLPTSAQRMPTSGDVVATGDGNTPGAASPVPMELKAGDTILYSKFGLGCTDLLLAGDNHILLRASDVIGTMPRTGARAEDIPELKPLGDRVLLRVQEAAAVTAGGVVLPESAKARPMAGEVVRTGPGKWDEEGGARVEPKVKAGDRVLFFKYAGDAMETPAGEMYTVVHESDILCKT